MRNTVYVKQVDLDPSECVCCIPKHLISVQGKYLIASSEDQLTLIENKSYELLIDITGSISDDYYTEPQFFLKHDPALDVLNELANFLTDGTISKQDFDTLIEDKVGIFEPEIDDESICYKIIGLVQGEYLIAHDIYFYIGKNHKAQNGEFLIVNTKMPNLCIEMKC